MNDDELGQSLQAMYRAIDPRRAPQGLDARIGDALETRPSRPVFAARTRPAFAAAVAAVAAVLIVAIGLGLRPGGFLTAPGGSPVASRLTATPSLTATPTPGFACASPARARRQARPERLRERTREHRTRADRHAAERFDAARLHRGLDRAPASTARGRAGQRLVRHGLGGGYLALGRQDYPAPTPAWISHDGRSWSNSRPTLSVPPHLHRLLHAPTESSSPPGATPARLPSGIRPMAQPGHRARLPRCVSVVMAILPATQPALSRSLRTRRTGLPSAPTGPPGRSPRCPVTQAPASRLSLRLARASWR